MDTSKIPQSVMQALDDYRNKVERHVHYRSVVRSRVVAGLIGDEFLRRVEQAGEEEAQARQALLKALAEVM